MIPKCNAGEFRNRERNLACEPCPTGFFQNESNTETEECLACKWVGDVYADKIGQSECEPCPANTQKKMPEQGESGDADSILICECLAGFLRVLPPWMNAN